MDLKEILFYIFLVLSVILLVWYAFGNSPTEFIVLITIMFTILLKIWSISDKQIKTEIAFRYLAKDFKEHIQHK